MIRRKAIMRGSFSKLNFDGGQDVLIGENLKIRSVSGSNEDLSKIASVSASRFPGGRSQSEARAHHTRLLSKSWPGGPVFARLLENPEGEIQGYVFFQIRFDGDLYIVEIATRRRLESDRSKGAGALLLRAAVEHGSQAECALVTLSLVFNGEIMSFNGPAAFYRKFGLKLKSDASGYCLTGRRRHRGDWMVGKIEDCRARLTTYLNPVDPAV